MRRGLYQANNRERGFIMVVAISFEHYCVKTSMGETSAYVANTGGYVAAIAEDDSIPFSWVVSYLNNANNAAAKGRGVTAYPGIQLLSVDDELFIVKRCDACVYNASDKAVLCPDVKPGCFALGELPSDLGRPGTYVKFVDWCAVQQKKVRQKSAGAWRRPTCETNYAHRV